MRNLYLITIIILVSLNLRPAITSVGPLVNYIQQDLAMGALMISLMTTLPVLCMGIFALGAVHLSQKFGLERALVMAMLGLSLALGLRAVTQSPFLLLTTALLAGMGIAIAGPLTSGFLKKYFSTNATVTSLYSVCMVIGAALAASLSVPLYQFWHASWQASLASWSILAVLALLLLLPISRARHPEPAQNHSPRFSIDNPRLYWFMLYFGSMSATFYTLVAWLAPLVQTMGLTHTQSGLVLTLFTAIQIPVSFIVPIMVSHFGHRRNWLLFCVGCTLTGTLLLAANASPWLASICFAVGLGGLFPLGIIIPIEEATSPSQATTWTATTQFGGYLISAIGPLTYGLVTDLFPEFNAGLIVLLILIAVTLFTVIKIGDKPNQNPLG